MINSKVLDVILRRVGNRRNPKVRDAALEELVIRIGELERQPAPPWFLETVWPATLTTENEKIALPTDFLLEIEETVLILDVGGVKYKVKKRVLHDLRNELGNTLPGIPKYYALFGNDVIFAPAPKEAYSFTLPYIRKSTPFLDNSTEASDWLEFAFNPMVFSACAAIAADTLQNDEMGQKYAQMASGAWGIFNNYCEARRYTNLELSTGDDE